MSLLSTKILGDEIKVSLYPWAQMMSMEDDVMSWELVEPVPAAPTGSPNESTEMKDGTGE